MVGEKVLEKAAEKAAEKLAEKAAEKAAEKLAEKAAEKAAEKLAEKAAEKAAEKLAEKTTEKAGVNVVVNMPKAGFKFGTLVKTVAATTAVSIGGSLYYLDDTQKKKLEKAVSVFVSMGETEEHGKILTKIYAEAGGDPENAPAAYKEYKASVKKDAAGLKNISDEGFKKFAQEQIAKQQEPLPTRLLDKAKDFLTDPDTFGAGSLVFGGALAVLGAWLGGAWLAVPLALIGGLFGESVLSTFTKSDAKDMNTAVVTPSKPKAASANDNAPGQLVPGFTPPQPKPLQPKAVGR